MAFRWRADDGPLVVVFGSSLPISPKKAKKKKKKKKKKLQQKKKTLAVKTFWIRAWFAPLFFGNLKDRFSRVEALLFTS